MLASLWLAAFHGGHHDGDQTGCFARGSLFDTFDAGLRKHESNAAITHSRANTTTHSGANTTATCYWHPLWRGL